MMTNSYKIIKDRTGYEPGKLYLYLGESDGKLDEINKEEFKDECGGIYDLDTGNYHIVPERGYKDNQERLDAIEIVRNNIRKKILEEIDICNLGSRGGKGQLAYEKFIQVNRQSDIFLLCFERLYRHKDKVYCVLGKFQFFKYSKVAEGVNKRKTLVDICYPCGYKDELGYKNSFGHIVKNSKYSGSVFSIRKDDIEDIKNEFLCFVNNY